MIDKPIRVKAIKVSKRILHPRVNSAKEDFAAVVADIEVFVNAKTGVKYAQTWGFGIAAPPIAGNQGLFRILSKTL